MTLHELRRRLGQIPPDTMIRVGWILEQLPDGEEEAVEDELLTLDQVAEEVDRAVSTVRTWCNRGELEAFKLRGREWRVRRSALHHFLEREAAGDGEPDLEDPGVEWDDWRDD